MDGTSMEDGGGVGGFDPRDLTWGGMFERPRDRRVVRVVETLTGRLQALRLILPRCR